MKGGREERPFSLVQFVHVIVVCLGEHPGRVVAMKEMVDVVKKGGLPVARGTVHKLQMRGTGPAHFIYGNKAIYRVGDAIEWALSRTRVGTAQERVAA